MKSTTFLYPTTIKETHLDSFGHVNNAIYLTLFEDARWDFINKNNYGIEKIKSTGLGPVILEININFKRELLPRDEIIIKSQLQSYDKKIGTLNQSIYRSDKVCCTADFVFGLYDINSRKLTLPTQEWLNALGI